MKKLFDIDSPFLASLSRVLDMLLINLLVLVCSLPLVTVGAALTAANRVVQNMIFDTDTHIYRVFFAEFRENLKRGILAGLLSLAVGCVLVCDLLWIRFNASGITGLLLYILLALLLLLAVSFFAHLYLLMARYNNSFRAHLYNALALTVANPIRTVLLAVLITSPLLIFLFSPSLFFRLIPFFLCLYPMAVIYCVNRLTQKTLLLLESGET